jgi:hypothetical protein
MVSIKHVFLAFLIFAGIQGLQAFGDQQPTSSGRQSDKMPVHSKPKEKTEKFIADITDERSVIRVQWLTFTGDQKIGGLRKENDDSSNALDLENIKEIVIKERFHEVKRYPNMIFSLVEVTFKSGVKDTYLFPQDVVICAEEIDPKCPAGPTECPKGEKAWHLNTVNKIEIIDDPSKPLATISEEKKSTESSPSRPQEESMSKTVTTTQSLEDFQEKKPDTVLEKKEYKEMGLKIVDKDSENFKEKTVMGTAKDAVKAIIVFIKAIFEAIKRWIW